MNGQSIVVAIQQIDYMITMLQNLSVELRYRLIDEPDKILLDAISVGFPKEIAERYRLGYMSLNIDKVEGIIIDINQVHIPYLEGLKQKLIKILNI